MSGCLPPLPGDTAFGLAFIPTRCTSSIIHHIVINMKIEKHAPWLAIAKPLLVLMTFVITTLYVAILDVFVDSLAISAICAKKVR